jgi:hypothetical protein
VKELLERIRSYLEDRSPRERWLLVLAVCVLALIAVNLVAIGPLATRAERAEAEASRLEAELTRALRIASEVRTVQGELIAVESSIRPGEKVNLLSLLEQLASQATINKNQLESIKPKRPSGNPRYPETRVEVSLKGTTLKQTVDFLYRIETAPMLLIVRALRIKSRGGPANEVDAIFTVSTFERA